MGFSCINTVGHRKSKMVAMQRNPDGTYVQETTQLLECTIHSINNITRNTDAVGKIDPYVILYANGQMVGKTKPVNNTNDVVIEELFILKMKEGVDAKEIKFKFDLMDEDDIGADDEVGSGTFFPAGEESWSYQDVHLKYKGKDIGSLTFSMVPKDILVIGRGGKHAQKAAKQRKNKKR